MEKTVDRKKSCFRMMGILLGVVFTFALISATIGSAAEPKPPIKIGILYPLTGPYTFLGERMLRGWELALEQVNYQLSGRPIKLIVEDTKGEPSVGVTKVTKLIEKDQVHILGGVVSSAVALALRDIVDRSAVPLIITMANAGALTREKRSPYVFRVYPAGGTGSHYLADYLHKELKLRKAVFSGADYAYGREHAEMFKKEFEKLGGQVLFENFTPLGTIDFAAYVTKLADFAGKADLLHFVYSGTDAIRFVKSMGEYGLNKKFVVSNWGGTTDGTNLREMGAAAEGMYLAQPYVFDVKNEANRRFLELDRRKGGPIPVDQVDVFGYSAALVVLQVLEKVKGNVESKDEFLKALRSAQVDSPMGSIRFDPQSQNWLVNLVISQAKKVDGEYGKFQNVIIYTFSQVQDPWWERK
jgi:branched-chain amino acid transport system substrate-binding protein